VFLLGAAGILVSVFRRRRGRKLTKILVALVAGSVCGALWMLLVDTVANTIRTDTISQVAVLLVGVVTALVAALFLSAPESLMKVTGLSMIVIGFHSLALPIAALISFLVAGEAWLPGASAELRTVGLSVAGLLVGTLLIFLGDRVLRVRRMRAHRHR
jgi:drug/metabolite transporter (DMT)-like permease